MQFEMTAFAIAQLYGELVDALAQCGDGILRLWFLPLLYARAIGRKQFHFHDIAGIHTLQAEAFGGWVGEYMQCGHIAGSNGGNSQGACR